jgi:hypothetical protein
MHLFEGSQGFIRVVLPQRVNIDFVEDTVRSVQLQLYWRALAWPTVAHDSPAMGADREGRDGAVASLARSIEV